VVKLAFWRVLRGVWGAKNLRKAFVYPSLQETHSFDSSNSLGFVRLSVQLVDPLIKKKGAPN